MTSPLAALRLPLWVVGLLLVCGLALIGLSFGLLTQGLRAPSRAADADAGDLQMMRQCPDGSALYRTADGRRLIWRQGWVRGGAADRPGAC